MGQTSTTDESNGQEKTAFVRVMEKAAEKKAKLAARKEDPNAEENKLVVERLPAGGLSVSWKLRGSIPHALQGQFTSRFQLEKAVIGQGYSLDILEY